MRTYLAFRQPVVMLVLLCLFFNLSAQAQMKVGQPSGSPDPSAALDVSGGPYSSGSQYRGIAPPKVALSQTSSATPITNPATGLLVYNTAKAGDVSPGYYYWEGTKWLRFTTASAGAARVAAVNGQSIPAYLISQVASLSTPDIIYIADPGKEGLFRYVANSSETADNAMVLAASGGRYKRIITDGRITPQMFGAIADDNFDDGPALLNWITYAGSYEHYLPAGMYKSSVELSRVDKGDFTLKGAGPGKSIIEFTADTDGMRVQNKLNNGHYGSINLSGFELYSSSSKTDRTALFINSEHEQYPGPNVSDITIRASSASQSAKWLNGLHYFDTGHSNTTNVNIFAGAELTVTTGILFENSINRSSVEHNLTQCSMHSTLRGVFLKSPAGTPQGHGHEGIHFSDCTIISTFSGITGDPVTGYQPDISFRNTHINTGGGPAVFLDGYRQLTFSDCIFYSNTDKGVIPPYTVGIKNSSFVSGDYQQYAQGNSPAGTYLMDGSARVRLSITGGFDSANTAFVLEDSTVDARVVADAQWTGNTKWGNTLKDPIVRLGSKPARTVPTVSGKAGLQGQVMRYDANTKYINEYVWPHVANTSREFFVNPGVTSVTVALADYDYISVNNGAGNVTIVLNRANATTGQEITVKRYDATSTGTITLTTDNTTYHLIQSVQGNKGGYFGSTTLPQGMRPITWLFNSSLFELKNGVGDEFIPNVGGASSGDLLYYNGTSWTRLPKGTDGQQLQLSSGNPAWVTPQQDAAFVTATTSQTITATAKRTYVGIGGAAPITLTINIASIAAGNSIYFFRYDNGSTGPITLATSNPNGNLIQDVNGNLNNSVTIPLTNGSRQIGFVGSGTHLHRISN